MARPIRVTLPIAVALASAALVNCSEVSPADDTGAQGAPITAERRVVATLQLSAYAAQMSELAARDIDIAGVDLENARVDLVVTPEELDRLRAEGFVVVTIQPVDQLADDLTKYQRPDTLARTLRGYAERHPTLAVVTSIGQSSQGRDILAVRITKDVGAPHSPDKPTVLFNGMHHARELMTSEVALDTVDVLLEKYGKDPRVTHWVDANEIWVVPMLNVDGNNQVWTSDKLWRKNTRGCMTSGACPRGSGVDINRNYPYKWAACNGSSASPASDAYRGPSAASEPETQAMMRLVDATRPVFDLSYHSYSELVLYPYGCNGLHTSTRALFEDIGHRMASLLPSDNGTHTYKAGTPWETIYGVDGDDIDWLFEEYAVVPFAIELGSSMQGFQPSYTVWRDKTVVKMRAAWQLLLDRLDGSGIRGVVRSQGGRIATSARVDVAAAGGALASPSRAVGADGLFHVVLLPGEYDVTVTAPGHTAVARHVSVGATRAALNVELD